MTIALELKQLKKPIPAGFRRCGIDLQVEAGDLCSAGPEWGRKSTTIGIISSLVNKTLVRSMSLATIWRKTSSMPSASGRVPQEFNFNPFETVQQIVVNRAGYYGVERKEALSAVKVFKQLDLWKNATNARGCSPAG